MGSIDGTIVTVALPVLTRSLDASLSWASWTITASQLVQIVVMPLAGKMSDSFGRKRVFLFTIACFSTGSLLCGLAPNIGFLIFFRVIEAIGAGGIMPSAVGIVSDEFGKERRTQVIGLFTSIFPIGGLIGPNVGGWILQNWGWREIFFINIPIGVIVLIGAHLLLREKSRVVIPTRVDLTGLAFFIGGMVSIMYSMTSVANDSGLWRTPVFWLLLATGITFFGLFVRHERRAAEPILDVELVTRFPFLPVNVYNFIYGVVVFGFFAFIPYYAVVQYNMTAVQSGVILTPRSVAGMVTATLTSVFLLRLGYRKPMILGTLILSACLVMLSFGWNQVIVGPLELDGFWLSAVIVGLSGIGTGLAAAPSNNASIDLLPDKAAALTGLRGMFRMIGGIIGISSVVLVLSFFEDKAAGLRMVFLAMAVVLQFTLPLVLMIPDTARELRREQLAMRGR